MSEQWISCEEQMPEAERRVLVYYKNSYDKNRIEIGEYIPSETVSADEFLNDCDETSFDYDEENDCYWIKEGWYESSWTAGIDWMIDEKITHWMPLPKLPVLEGESK